MARISPALRKSASLYIDSDLPPREPEGYRFVSGDFYGMIQWDPQSIHLFQGRNERLHVEALWVFEEAAKRKPVNATVLDFLLDHQELIPEHWKENERGQTRFIYFCGSVFRSEGGFRWVRYLYWNKDDRNWDHGLICLSRSYLHDDGYAAVFS